MIAKTETAGGEVALLVLGLDGFQQINDMLGHASGDLVLQAISERLKAAIPVAGTVARLSGDEFCIAAPIVDIGGDVGRFA
ncbi:GGDEF domain-containing protein, partial [Acinetobacter baumannii]